MPMFLVGCTSFWRLATRVTLEARLEASHSLKSLAFNCSILPISKQSVKDCEQEKNKRISKDNPYMWGMVIITRAYEAYIYTFGRVCFRFLGVNCSRKNKDTDRFLRGLQLGERFKGGVVK